MADPRDGRDAARTEHSQPVPQRVPADGTVLDESADPERRRRPLARAPTRTQGTTETDEHREDQRHRGCELGVHPAAISFAATVERGERAEGREHEPTLVTRRGQRDEGSADRDARSRRDPVALVVRSEPHEVMGARQVGEKRHRGLPPWRGLQGDRR